MKLKSFGCSFIFGSDLSDNKFNRDGSLASIMTWPAHLARSMNMQYECHAIPGAGNLNILEQVLNEIPSSSQHDIFVIGWTWIDRFDYFNTSWNGISPLSPWNTIRPADKNDINTVYYRDLHSEYKDKLTSLIYVKTAIDMLKQNNIEFIMTYADQIMFDRQWHTSLAVLDLQEKIQPHMTLFDNLTFLEWSRSNNFPESTSWHPLEQAHKEAAKLLLSFFDKQNKGVLAPQVLS